jgi:hypothetical protein
MLFHEVYVTNVIYVTNVSKIAILMSMDKQKLKSWIDEQLEALGSTEFAKRLGISRAAIRSLQLLEVDSLRHDTIKAIATFRGQTVKEVKAWLDIESQSVKQTEPDRLAKLEEGYEVLQTEVVELKKLVKVLAKELNGLKKSKTGKVGV